MSSHLLESSTGLESHVDVPLHFQDAASPAESSTDVQCDAPSLEHIPANLKVTRAMLHSLIEHVDGIVNGWDLCTLSKREAIRLLRFHISTMDELIENLRSLDER